MGFYRMSNEQKVGPGEASRTVSLHIISVGRRLHVVVSIGLMFTNEVAETRHESTGIKFCLSVSVRVVRRSRERLRADLRTD